MYFPYLYGRQAELNAIRLSRPRLGDPQKIFPIIEPVNVNTSQLVHALADFDNAAKCLYLVVNPERGEFRRAAQPNGVNLLTTAIQPYASVRPTFLEQPQTALAAIQTFAASNAGQEVAVIVSTNRIAASRFAGALGQARVILFLLPAVDPRPYVTAFGPQSIVQITDNFRTEARNADYSGEEWLTNNHLDYASSNQLGFSDYTILPGRYSDGGGPVGAAAFHLTFKHADGSFWLQHFVSDEHDKNVGNTSTKLLEAIAHLRTQLALTPNRFHHSSGIVDYLRQGRTGLATNLSGNKKLEICHHLHEVSVHLGI